MFSCYVSHKKIFTDIYIYIIYICYFTSHVSFFISTSALISRVRNHFSVACSECGQCNIVEKYPCISKSALEKPPTFKKVAIYLTFYMLPDRVIKSYDNMYTFQIKRTMSETLGFQNKCKSPYIKKCWLFNMWRHYARNRQGLMWCGFVKVK